MFFPKKRTKCLAFILWTIIVFYIPLNVLSFLSVGNWKKKYYLKSNRGLHEIPGNTSAKLNRTIEIQLDIDFDAKSDGSLIGRILHSLQAKLKDLDIKLNITRKGNQQLAKSDINPLNDTQVTSCRFLVFVLRGLLTAWQNQEVIILCSFIHLSIFLSIHPFMSCLYCAFVPLENVFCQSV